MKGKWIWLIIIIIVIGLIFGGRLVTVYTDWIWFKELGFSSVYTKILFTKLAVALGFGILFFIVFYLNVLIAERVTRYLMPRITDELWEIPDRYLYDKYGHKIMLGVALFLSPLVALAAVSHWETILRFLNSTAFGLKDPIFKADVGFYVFRLPFWGYLYGWWMGALMFIFVVTGGLYLLFRGIQVTSRGVAFARCGVVHLSILGALWLFLKVAGYKLIAYRLLYSPHHILTGIAYTDLHVRLPLLKALMVFAGLAGIIVLLNIRWRSWRPPVWAIGIWLSVSLFAGAIYPGVIQRLQVLPNEVKMERPFIKNHIQFTRKAYNLDEVRVEQFPAEETLTLKDLEDNALTIQNIRLWDHRPLLSTYKQLQEIRTYYKFANADVDRYYIHGRYRQVILSARELSYEDLPSRIWINEHLMFTHGYGVCMSPVSHVTEEGMPDLIIKDIPPISVASDKVTKLQLERPELYYGELSNDYVIVNTEAKEFDYPAGTENVYTTYRGNGDVPVSNSFRKLMLAWRLKSIKILLNRDITAQSRIMYYRQVRERFKKACPVIQFDADPYIVTANGKLYWFCDGYTFTDAFPYSQAMLFPYPEPAERKQINYVRNSIKAVLDAYNGKLTFYISDPQDPIIQTYHKIFPALFRSLDEMPAALKQHIRYPQDLFKIQAGIYRIYHMTDPRVFYNKEDVWNIPKEVFGAEEQFMEPYYIIMRLPKERAEEFILLVPFTPMGKNNMAAWLCARCDFPNYGKLIVFQFPKKKLVYGPTQVEARIDQEPDISRQLSLWNQRGSQVIRGNLLVIPIKQSILYVEPLYLKAEKSELPELKRVIVAFGKHVAMEETLDDALGRVFAGKPAVLVAAEAAEEVPAAKPVAPTVSIDQLAAQALEHYNRAKQAYRRDDWSEFGKQWKVLEEDLKALNQHLKK